MSTGVYPIPDRISVGYIIPVGVWNCYNVIFFLHFRNLKRSDKRNDYSRRDGTSSTVTPCGCRSRRRPPTPRQRYGGSCRSGIQADPTGLLWNLKLLTYNSSGIANIEIFKFKVTLLSSSKVLCKLCIGIPSSVKC